jgi:hypothetical protein
MYEITGAVQLAYDLISKRTTPYRRRNLMLYLRQRRSLSHTVGRQQVAEQDSQKAGERTAPPPLANSTCYTPSLEKRKLTVANCTNHQKCPQPEPQLNFA